MPIYLEGLNVSYCYKSSLDMLAVGNQVFDALATGARVTLSLPPLAPHQILVLQECLIWHGPLLLPVLLWVFGSGGLLTTQCCFLTCSQISSQAEKQHTLHLCGRAGP